ncbi:hypothetical protein GIB67_031428 [Kingdonia uniflora]|uniref:CCHC-type domain-containing protein n=1 Tax=Kingdonia uniflora TaxID=39325 RepID=A0A7J7MB34_9MAGN|nr:hypothetical protein GIB67_031428 [Kingdonia uniflora]
MVDSGKRSFNKFRKGTCWGCGESGHYRSDCKIGKDKGASSVKGSKSDTNKLATVSSNNSDEALLVVAADGSHHDKGWVFDSGDILHFDHGQLQLTAVDPHLAESTNIKNSFSSAYLATPRRYYVETPSLMVVKSVSVSQSSLLQKEKYILTHFGDCPEILRCFGDDFTVEDGKEVYNILLEFASRELPVIPDELCDDGKDFLIRCFTRDPMTRWTAEMLLNHPFVILVDSDASPRSAFDFPKWSSPSLHSRSLTCFEEEWDCSALESTVERIRQLDTKILQS